MMSILELISIPLKWEQVDSHIECKVYKEGAQPNGDEYYIMLNKVVDGWAGTARAIHMRHYPHYLYIEGFVTVRRSNDMLIYGDLDKVVTDDINRNLMSKYLWGKIPHWNNSMFESIDWHAIETCMNKLAKKTGSLFTNSLKLLHKW